MLAGYFIYFNGGVVADSEARAVQAAALQGKGVARAATVSQAEEHHNSRPAKNGAAGCIQISCCC